MKISTRFLTAVSVVGIATNGSAQGLKPQTRIGCFSSAGSLKDQGSHTWQSTGYCQTKAGTELKKPVMGLTAGSNCWAGDEYPPKDKQVEDSFCDANCQGFPNEKCGGVEYWEVFLTGLKSSAQYADSSSSSSNGPSTSGPSSSNKPTPTASAAPSVITEAGQTIVVTAPGQADAAASAAAAAASASAAARKTASSGGPNKVGIAAGVVVGFVVVIGLAVAAFFFLRNRKRRAIEEEYRRNAAINNMSSGKADSLSSMGDSRLEPSVMLQRRMSDGSIADNQDYSRRILKVTNPDGK